MIDRFARLLGVLSLALLFAGCGAAGPAAPRGRSVGTPARLLASTALPAIGSPAPALTIQDLGGSSHSLSDLHGKGVVVTFFATWCPHCQKELAALDAMVRKICPCRGLAVLPVDAVDENAKTLEAFREKLGLDIPVYRDPGAAATGQWGIEEVPTLFFVDRKGILAAKRTGEVPPGELGQLVEAILKYGS